MQNQSEGGELKRVVGVSGLSFNIINITIGAGIFALPATVAISLGAFSVVAYIFCGLMMAAIMLCYAEIGTRVNSSGGSYAYVSTAFGDYAGFVVSCLTVFGWSILGSAALLNIVADSLSVIYPLFEERWARTILFLLLMGVLAATNIKGAKSGVSFVKWITLIKILPLLALILFGMSMVDPELLKWEEAPGLRSFGSTALVLFFAFAGFETALGASGEIINPRRTVPLGILIGGSLVMILYLLLQTVVQGVLGANMDIVKDAPLAALAERVIGSSGIILLLLAAAVSCFGAVGSDVFNTPRILYAGARSGLYPEFLAKVHSRYATPYWSIIVFCGLIFLFAISGSFEQLAVLASASILIIYMLVIFAMLRLRKVKNGNEGQSFRVPGGVLIPILGILAIAWLLYGLTPVEKLSCMVFVMLASLFYYVRKWISEGRVKAEQP